MDISIDKQGNYARDDLNLAKKGISEKITWTYLRSGNLKREIGSLLIGIQNNVIRTYYIIANINNTQKNGRCRLYGDRTETVNHIISECSKLASKEYKSKHDWVRKVIQ